MGIRVTAVQVAGIHSRGTSMMRTSPFSLLVLGVLFVTAAMLTSTSARADVCVWRDPERTMARLFPNALDYKTITKKVTPELARQIEERVGVKLDESERIEFNYYDITGRVDGRSQKIGTVLALAGPGEYGTIEVVIGLSLDERIVGVYIQRIRERAADKLRAAAFLSQFRGKTKDDQVELDASAVVVPHAEKASRTIVLAVRKMLVFHDVLKGLETEKKK